MSEEVLTGARDMSQMSDDQVREVIAELEHRNEELAESMTQLRLAVDDIGWKPLGVHQSTEELPLDTIKKAAETCRALATINPLVKRGIAVRTSYIWGGGVQLGQRSERWYNRSVRRTIGDTVAQLELERSAASDGNLIFLVDTVQRTVQRVPFHQMSGTVTAPDDNETVLYYKRTYTEFSTDLSNVNVDGTLPTQEVRHVWYPSEELEARPVDSIANVPVDRTKRIVHVAFNRQVGWTWGVPDVFAVVFWSKAYKEFLENCATLQKAYARFAWKVTSSTKKGTSRVATKMAEPPQRDPVTGNYNNVGASVALGAGQDMQALQTVRPVDFSSGLPLASMIAAGLEIPLPMLTSDPGSGNRATAETLDEPTKLAMESRQQLMDDVIRRIKELLGAPETEIEWPPVDDEPTHRKVQAADMAGRTGMLFPREWRELIMRAAGLEFDDREPPNEEQLPVMLQSNGDGPAQVDPMSRGDHELRDEGLQSHTD